MYKIKKKNVLITVGSYLKIRQVSCDKMEINCI